MYLLSVFEETFWNSLSVQYHQGPWPYCFALYVRSELIWIWPRIPTAVRFHIQWDSRWQQFIWSLYLKGFPVLCEVFVFIIIIDIIIILCWICKPRALFWCKAFSVKSQKGLVYRPTNQRNPQWELTHQRHTDAAGTLTTWLNNSAYQNVNIKEKQCWTVTNCSKTQCIQTVVTLERWNDHSTQTPFTVSFISLQMKG